VPNKSVIPVSRDLRPFLTPPVERSLLRDQFKISPEQIAIIHVGRMEDDPKNQEALIRAFAQTDPKHNALLLFAGDGPKRKGFEELANQLAPGRVRFLGLVSEMAELYHAADGLVLPSLWEGRPLVVMEAVAAGLPCLFSPIAPLKEVAQGLEGVLYTEGTDVESIRSGLEQALSSWGPSRWRRDKDNCSLIIQSWGIEQCAKLHWGPEGYDLKP
jgi:glycosyltransferase involved in cell wall biosynthesis